MDAYKQRIAIAEACGWTFDIQQCPYGTITYATKNGCGAGNVPNYPNDLNAMHEAEKLFEAKTAADLNKADRTFIYTSHLARICIGHFGGQTRATAAQRAEAFLKTIGKWEDEVTPDHDKP